MHEYVKRYGSLLLALALILVAATYPQSFQFNNIAGCGNGESAQITSLENISLLAENLSRAMNRSPLWGVGNSLHMYIEKEMQLSYETYGASQSEKFTLSLNGGGDYYLTTEGKIYIDASIEMNGVSYGEIVYISADMKIYMDTFNTYVYTTHIEMVQDGVTMNIPSMMLRKWIDFTETNYGYSGAFDQIFGAYTNTLSVFAKYTQSEDNFEKDGDVYTMKPEPFKEQLEEQLAISEALFGLTHKDLDIDGEFKVDLSNKEKSKIEQSYSFVWPETIYDCGETIYINNDVPNKEKTNITFMDVGNTVVQFPDDEHVYSVQEMKELLEGVD